MKKFLNSKFGEAIVLTGATVLNLIFTIAYCSVKLSEFFFNGELVRGEQALWATNELYVDMYIIKNFNVIFVVLFCVGAGLSLASALLAFFKNKKRLFYISTSFNLTLSAVVVIVHLLSGILRAGAVVLALLSIAISVAVLIFMIIRRDSIANREDGTEREESVVTLDSRAVKRVRVGMIACVCLSTLMYLLTPLFPLYSETVDGSSTTYYLIRALFDSESFLYLNIAFIVMAMVCFCGILYLASSASSFAKSNKTFALKTRKYMYASTLITAVFFVVGYSLTFFYNLNRAEDNSAYSASTVSYIPLVISSVVLVVYSVLQGRLPVEEADGHTVASTKRIKLEPLIFSVIITAITFASLALNLLMVETEYNIIGATNGFKISLSGYELLKRYSELEAGFQATAFMLTAFLSVSGVLLVITLVNFFAKNSDFYKNVKVSAITNFLFVFAIGLFGLYFKIAQKVNEENILSLLSMFGITAESLDYVNDVSSQGYIATLASFALLVAMFARGQFELSAPVAVESARPSEASAERDGEASAEDEDDSDEARDEQTDDVADVVEPKRLIADACPAFTELDMKIEQFNAELDRRNACEFDEVTLPKLARFVVDYARECRLHLSYSLEDMATFVAGLGASRLSILQGMSGTGKTSLPKIFTEAIMGTCEIVEVESSWRDKNELLGFYNEFSKCYTPKKFTQCLYKARLNSTVPTFIVLDEMNLSRIEYYFSDFLSLMENEEDKREIRLLNTKLSRIEEGETVEYRGLVDGHTIKIPSNVWFIGTANRDESTFEISDKVYDRAQTMNFNKRAPKVNSFSEPLRQRFVPYGKIATLFDEAKRQYEFDAEQNVIIQKVEKLLLPYNISFGNRILRQMEDFVKIYCACFGDRSEAEKDAVEKILLSKVVSKLENKIVENKQALVVEFTKLGLNRCAEFVKNLNED